MARNIGLQRILGSLSLCAVLLLAVLSQPAHALMLNDYPDIRLSGINVHQTPTSFWTTDGVAETFFASPSSSTSLYDPFLGYAYFDLAALLNGSGGLVSGTFSIYDDLVNDGVYGAGDHLYLSGDLTSFRTTASTYEFLFTPSAGQYLADYDTLAHINISIVGDGDVRTVVPEPSTICLLLLGTGGLLLARRRKSHSQV